MIREPAGDHIETTETDRRQLDEMELEEMVSLARADRAVCQEAFLQAGGGLGEHFADETLEDARMQLTQALAVELGYRRLLEMHHATERKDGDDH